MMHTTQLSIIYNTKKSVKIVRYARDKVYVEHTWKVDSILIDQYNHVKSHVEYWFGLNIVLTKHSIPSA